MRQLGVSYPTAWTWLHKLRDAVTWDTQPWLERFHELGLTAADVDFVMCTHLHIDHTGWNTRLEQGRWVPTFPNATYLFERREYAYWREVAETGIVPPRQHGDVWTINCLPVVEAGQADIVQDCFSPFPAFGSGYTLEQHNEFYVFQS